MPKPYTSFIQNPISSLLYFALSFKLPLMNKTSTTETIFALSSAAGKAGVSIIRVSGSKALSSLKTLTPSHSAPTIRKTKLVTLRNPETKAPIDKAMIIYFEGPHSFTGEDVVEYHCHGSPAVIKELLEALGKLEDHRLAQHGEFTRRAFDNGRMDLTEAEAIADLIDAETLYQKEQALMQMDGALSNLYNGWAEELTKSLAYIEAIIDFPDEDVPDTETAKAKPAIEKLSIEIMAHLNDGRRGERLRDGIKIAIIGAPNAGKSSLVNALSQREIAIVSDMAGTTRDVIDVHLNIAGFPVILSDTAGLRPDQIGTDGHDKIEAEGMRRALQAANDADIRILMFDMSLAELDNHTTNLINENSLIVYNKKDLASKQDAFHVKHNIEPFIISTNDENDLQSFIQGLGIFIKEKFSVSRETPSLTRERYRQNLEEASEFLSNSLLQDQPELMAQDLRFAIHALGRITGRIDVEDLLDVIFKDFCIGK